MPIVLGAAKGNDDTNCRNFVIPALELIEQEKDLGDRRISSDNLRKIEIGIN